MLKQDSHERSGRFVNQFIKVGLLQHQFDALTSLVFNIGGPAFIGNQNKEPATILKSVNAEKHKQGEAGREEIRENFMRFVLAGGVKLKGLESRRAHEATLFLDGIYD